MKVVSADAKLGFVSIEGKEPKGGRSHPQGRSEAEEARSALTPSERRLIKEAIRKDPRDAALG